MVIVIYKPPEKPGDGHGRTHPPNKNIRFN